MRRVLVVDDESLARQRLSHLVGRVDGFVLCGEARNSEEALRLQQKEGADILLLDIEMPGGSGLNLAYRLSTEEAPPELVFVTAFAEYAVDAFERGAIDYVLKPVRLDRLSEALNRADKQLALRTAEERAARLQEALTAFKGEGEPEDLWIKNGGSEMRLSRSDIRYASSDRDYVYIVAQSGSYHIRSTMTGLAKKLGDASFLRIHRSHVVRKEEIRGFSRVAPDRFEVELNNGDALPVGASYVSKVRELIG
ncbi:LytR/AlgR family response regulator transcription factor [Parvularcula maris]|uniref:LytTR family DNA-binding domain-containing protein n=1 Tax=Parvularcula maris TaxID=2965077 RepID=A0A9X2L7T6_9PROT|nr:LytTR family DNA-binding domain-containing protein [Parvularcula maris]MCQ8184684.1 LytTR family DNA-binding domain-containing protein [Parvularcula maris]